MLSVEGYRLSTPSEATTAEALTADIRALYCDASTHDSLQLQRVTKRDMTHLYLLFQNDQEWSETSAHTAPNVAVDGAVMAKRIEQDAILA